MLINATRARFTCCPGCLFWSQGYSFCCQWEPHTSEWNFPKVSLHPSAVIWGRKLLGDSENTEIWGFFSRWRGSRQNSVGRLSFHCRCWNEGERLQEREFQIAKHKVAVGKKVGCVQIKPTNKQKETLESSVSAYHRKDRTKHADFFSWVEH